MKIEISQANRESMTVVSDILIEAARWLRSKGEPLWAEEKLIPQELEKESELGIYFLATVSGEPAGVYRFQEKDLLFWPEAKADEATYIHRLSVRRPFAGKGIASALIHHAARRTEELNRVLLRLDCEATRPKLRSFYEGLGFRLHSLSQVGHFFAARYEKTIGANNKGFIEAQHSNETMVEQDAGQ